MLACIFQHWYCLSQNVGQTSLPQATPTLDSLLFSFYILSPINFNQSWGDNHQKLTTPHFLFSSQISLSNFKIYTFNCSPDISIWISQIPQRNRCQNEHIFLQLPQSTLLSANFALSQRIVPSPSSWKKNFPYHRPLSHSFWVASFLIMSRTRGWAPSPSLQ